MAEVILMPRLSDTMTEGVIASWNKKVGDPVKKGDVLAEIETDKATMELESYKDGTLLHVGADKGGKIQVNDLLAIIGNAGEDIASLIGGAGNGAAQSNTGQPDMGKSVTQESTPVGKGDGDLPPQTGAAGSDAAQKSSGGMDLSKMEEVVLMPRLSDTMTDGVIATWHKNVGDAVKKGDVLADIETDKATMELESYKNGTLLHQGAAAGTKIAVNDLLAIIGDAGKVDVQGIVAAAQGGGGNVEQKSKEGGTEEGGGKSVQPSTNNAQQSTPNVNQPQTPNPEPQTNNGRIKASPLAKRLAREKGIDINQVQGSGDGGRIVKQDIDNFKPSAQPALAATASAQQPTANDQLSTVNRQLSTGQESHKDIQLSQMRKVIAKRLSESMFGAPHFYLGMEITMDNAMAARAQMNEVSEVKISFNDMVVKAAAMALRKHPAVNASWMGDYIRQYDHVHVGVAVAIEDGLIVPVIRFADQKGLSAIAAEVKELAGKAKSKKLQPQEFSGNTFTISNLGMMDIDEFTAIINPPDSAIMAVGRIKEVVVKKGDSFAVSNVMKVTLSCDHRSVDGAVGAAFLQTFKKYLENPVTMLV